MSPARRRDAVRYLVRRGKVSERRACRVVGQYRSTQRYERVAPAYELKLVARMNELAAEHPRYGYRRVWEEAQARALLAQAHAALGDREKALLELRTASTAFERLGASIAVAASKKGLAELA